MVALSSLIYIYKFLERDLVLIDPVNQNALPSNVTNDEIAAFGYEYHLKYNDIANSKTILWTRFVTSFLRDFLTSVIIFVLNIKTLNFMKLTIINKQKLNTLVAKKPSVRRSPNLSPIKESELSNGSDVEQSDRASTLNLRPTGSNNSNAFKFSKLNYSKIERNITRMVVINGFVCIIGHFPFFVVFLPIKNFGLILGKCYSSINYTLFYSSYSINFFIYFFFNKKFQSFILDKIRPLLGKVSSDSSKSESTKLTDSSSAKTCSQKITSTSQPEQKHLLKDFDQAKLTTVL